MVAILVQQGKITEEEAQVHPDRSKLFTSLGGPEAPQIAFGSIDRVEPGDTVLLASDGIEAIMKAPGNAIDCTSAAGLPDTDCGFGFIQADKDVAMAQDATPPTATISW